MNSFSFSRLKLLSALNAIRDFSDGTPLGSLAFFEASSGKALITCGMYTSQASVSVDIDMLRGDNFTFAVSARILAKWLALSSAEVLTAEADERKVTIFSGTERAEFQRHTNESGMVFWANLRETYLTSIDTDKKQVIDAVRSANTATNKRDATRRVLQGVCFSFANDTMSIAGTDTYRLVWTDIKIPSVQAEKEHIVDNDICTNMIEAFSSEFSDDSLSVSFGESKGIAVSGNITVYFPLIEGKYPPYKQIIPKVDASCAVVQCSAQELSQALKKLVLFADESGTSYTKFSIADNVIYLNTSTSRCDIGDAETSVGCQSGDKETPTQSYNTEYAMEVFALFDKATVTHWQSNKAVLIEQKGSATKALLMPIRS